MVVEQEQRKFELALKIIKELIDTNELFISMRPPFSVDFEIRKELLERKLKSVGMDEDEFQSLSDQISVILKAILENEEESFVEGYLREEEKARGEAKGEKEENRRALITTQVKMVRDQLYNKHLQGRYDLKRSCKAPAFTSVDWDIKVKTKDAKLGDLKFPYATLKITFQRNFEEDPLALFTGRTFDSVQLNFSVDELRYMSSLLGDIAYYLEQIEKGES